MSNSGVPNELYLIAAATPSSAGMLAWATNNWSVLWWGIWIAAFLVVEIPAIFNAKKGDTFSETWWRFLRIKGGAIIVDEADDEGVAVVWTKPFPRWVAIPLHSAVVLFGVWLIGHLGFGLWGGSEGWWFG